MTQPSSATKLSCAIPRALIVDDCAVTRRVHCRIMEQLGYDVVSASDGAQGVRFAAETAFDVILMDCQMPVMDGFAATRSLRALELGGKSAATVIGVTSSANRRECKQCGMDAFLPKPLQIDSLSQAIAIAGANK